MDNTLTTAALRSSTDMDWLNHYRTNLRKQPKSISPDIPNWFRSSFVYIVLENELTLKNKRRIVHLDNMDLLYNSVNCPCICLEINWLTDFRNVIKVHESVHTWETTFSELIATDQVAIRNLFARSQVWAEGNYQPLLKTDQSCMN